MNVLVAKIFDACQEMRQIIEIFEKHTQITLITFFGLTFEDGGDFIAEIDHITVEGSKEGYVINCDGIGEYTGKRPRWLNNKALEEIHNLGIDILHLIQGSEESDDIEINISRQDVESQIKPVYNILINLNTILDEDSNG